MREIVGEWQAVNVVHNHFYTNDNFIVYPNIGPNQNAKKEMQRCTNADRNFNAFNSYCSYSDELCCNTHSNNCTDYRQIF